MGRGSENAAEQNATRVNSMRIADFICTDCSTPCVASLGSQLLLTAIQSLRIADALLRRLWESAHSSRSNSGTPMMLECEQPGASRSAGNLGKEVIRYDHRCGYKQ